MLQGWMRRNSQVNGFWESSVTTNFKQSFGMCSDIVMKFVTTYTAPSTEVSITFMLRQLLDVAIECVAQPAESISRLGCLSQQVSAVAMVTLCKLSQQVSAVAMVTPSALCKLSQQVSAVAMVTPSALCKLSQQVFQLDVQRLMQGRTDDMDDSRSYIFLLYPPDAENLLNVEKFIVRVPFRNIVVGLLSHQILLQTSVCILLQGTPRVTPAVAGVQAAFGAVETDEEHKGPGMLRRCRAAASDLLLECLREVPPHGRETSTRAQDSTAATPAPRPHIGQTAVLPSSHAPDELPWSEQPKMRRHSSAGSEKTEYAAAPSTTTANPLQYHHQQPQQPQQQQQEYHHQENIQAVPPSPVSPCPSVEPTSRHDDSKVYNVTTRKEIHSLLSEYKKRKQQRSMPGKSRKDRIAKFLPKKTHPKSDDPILNEVEKQQQSSILKDGEAHMQSWTEMVLTLFHLLQQLEDDQFKMYLPLVFNGIDQLVCHATDVCVKEALSQWLHRVGKLYSLVENPEENVQAVAK
ncbi:PREDICTED: brefeldin A-inhibited guanine nucleotide-exchange protein 3-like [Priapulus caudatus]|uniref:Brefeldin A-inhibited guanine nucleotide-exchange protein 3-like n=1 Tax=Priapulus caudatus TaxID=37621 RepID=A0ABM1EW40_PRICU|nr:PREDICTED: brefeldin A-inhibited guanine nucleotide-exchange protein 3-like [Priapulus caudatus]